MDSECEFEDTLVDAVAEWVLGCWFRVQEIFSIQCTADEKSSTKEEIVNINTNANVHICKCVYTLSDSLEE